MRISVNDRLFFELQFARVLSTTFYAHGTIMIAIDFSQYNVIDGSGNFTPLKFLTILKLQGQNTYRIKLNRPTPELPSKVGITPKFPSHTVTMTSNNHWVVTNLKPQKYFIIGKELNPCHDHSIVKKIDTT